jgi:hypothetical protein
METLKDLYYKLNELREQTHKLPLQSETRFAVWSIIDDAIQEITKLPEF